MKQIHKAESEPGFLKAVAIVLFLAVCAYLGAGIYSGLDQDLKTVSVSCITVTDSLELTGLVIRREQLICSPGKTQIFLSSGERVPSNGLVAVFHDGTELYSPSSALFFPDYDGFEMLNPDMLSSLSRQELETLLQQEAEPDPDAIGRLVFGWEWYFAALPAEDAAFLPESRCTLLFDGIEQRLPAELISAGEDLPFILRLTYGGEEYLRLRKTHAQLIFSEYSGLELPEEAVRQDADGNEYVYTVTAGIIERRPVEIIYRADGRCIAAVSTQAEALREGNTLIVSGENIYEGRVISP